MANIDKRLIPNYIAGLAIIFVFLGGFIYVLVTPDAVTDLVIVDDDVGQTALRASGFTMIVTAMIFITKEVTTYLFRKNPSPVVT
ncbi:hypothetical protein LCGC14_1195030 [marine sediment metagenome]|uniref:Uncharacterized protein n=1 Tax=marine sediment metagenome TaxID=412755 RepID=A0A0F9M642_9ZZZZ